MNSGEATRGDGDAIQGERAPRTDARLLKLAGDVTDDVDIDWSDAPPGARSALRGLRLIAEVAAAYRTVGSGQVWPRPAFVWGPLHVHERIGAGTFGEVYRAWDPRLEIEVSLKLLRAEHDGALGNARVFLDEARRLARIRHRYVVSVRGVDVHDGRLGLWTDFVAGRSLEAYLGDCGPLSPEEVVRTGTRLCEAVDAVHEAGFVHGDVKASNVIRDESGGVFLTDFGAAVRIGRAPIVAVMATPLAMAPELFDGAPQSIASDVYALGALCFRLLTGRHVVEGRSLAAIRGNHRLPKRGRLRSLRPDVPAPLVRTIERALAAHPHDRFANMRELARALAASADPDQNLPRPRTSFFGREEDRRIVSQLLAPGRLVTLTGVGGAGKTRLAVEAAREALRRFPDGAAFVELDQVDANGVEEAIARSLAVRDPGRGSQIESIVTRLGAGERLLVLDNAEHVLERVAGVVDRLLDGAPSTALLVTSRERLGIEDETTYVVEPLPTPARADRDQPALLAGNPSIALFLDRARAVDPRFELSAGTARDIASLCRRLDGIPLALEIAAGSLHVSSLRELRRKLDEQGIDAVQHRARNIRGRHHTVRSLLDWSFGLLTGVERLVFARSSVFRGGFTPGAAKAVCRAGPAAPGAGEIEQALAALVDKSLIVRQEVREGRGAAEDAGGHVPGEDRYRLLEIVREYAAGRLGDDRVAVEAHLHYYAGSITPPGGAGSGSDSDSDSDSTPSPAWRAEEANLRAAVRAALATGRVDLAASIARALGEGWRRAGRYHEAMAVYRGLWERRADISDSELAVELWNDASICCDHLEAHDEAERFLRCAHELVHAGAVPPQHETRIVSNLGNAAMGRREYDRCVEIYQQALALARKHAQPRSEAIALGNLGIMARYFGDLERAWQCFADSERIARREGLGRQLGLTLFHQAQSALNRSELREGIRLCAESVRVHRRRGDLRELTLALTLLGRLQHLTGDLETAEATAGEALAIAERAGIPNMRASQLLGYLAYRRGEHDLSERFLISALLAPPWSPTGVQSTVGLMVFTSAAQGRAFEAAWMAGASVALDDGMGPDNVEGRMFAERLDRVVEELKDELGQETFDRAWNEGAALSAEEVSQRVTAAFPTHPDPQP